VTTGPVAAGAATRPGGKQLRIAAACVLVYFFTNGMALFVPQNLFPRFMESFAASPAEVSRTTAITFGVAGLLAPFVGAAIDRLGVVRVIRAGLLVLGLTFAAYPAARSLSDLYLLHGVIALGLILAGLMPNVVLLSRWFSTHRGTAVGVLVAGSSLAGAVLPLSISPLVNDPAFGWRFGMGALAVAFWLFAVLPGFLVLAEPGPAASRAGAGPPPPVDGVSFATALRSRTLWCLAVGSACLWFAIQAMTSQITIYFEEEAGLAPARATTLYATILACSVAGKFLFGAVSDRFRKQRVMVATSITLLAGCLLLFTAGADGAEGVVGLARDPVQLTAFAVIFGLGFGGSFTLIQLVAVESFGQLALGRILGIVTFVDTMGGAAGTLLAGQLRTATGDYFVTFTVVVVVALVALGNVLLIRPVARITNA